MSLNQLNDDLNDAFETYYAVRNPLFRLPYLCFSGLLLALHRLRRPLFRGRRMVNERIVEYPLALRWIRPTGSVLDIGCVSSRMPIHLASLGYTVHGLDVRPYPFAHPNFSMHLGDILTWTPPSEYDVILLISTLEHLGLGAYGDRTKPDADREAVGRIFQWLRPGGQLIASVPVGRPCLTRLHRIYDPDSLRKLFGDFEWLESAWFVRQDGHWRPGSEATAATADSSGLPVNAVGVFNLRKPGAQTGSSHNSM